MRRCRRSSYNSRVVAKKEENQKKEKVRNQKKEKVRNLKRKKENILKEDVKNNIFLNLNTR